ncbi:MAG: 2-C-methyl-D-erythritol 4-phosphate cytidylyltransferase [Magnetococcales bacterium]|nr:2-C-methyl-D-erythritol 4-phosphate cytidylyltransferase [Magnetococcales bacterium]
MIKRDLITFLVVAAGRGQRFGPDLPKQYQLLAGRPILWHTFKALQEHPLVGKIVPIIAKEGQELWRKVMGPEISGFSKLAQPVAGGSERQLSVANGLASLSLDDDQWVAIHDGVRPLVSHSQLDRLFDARQAGRAFLSAIPANDTVKQVGNEGRVERTLNRDLIWLAQTPQMFQFGLIMSAHKQAKEAGFVGTDDVSLIEWMGESVQVVMGDGANIKITRPADLLLAEALLAERTEG